MAPVNDFRAELAALVELVGQPADEAATGGVGGTVGRQVKTIDRGEEQQEIQGLPLVHLRQVEGDGHLGVHIAPQVLGRLSMQRLVFVHHRRMHHAMDHRETLANLFDRLAQLRKVGGIGLDVQRHRATFSQALKGRLQRGIRRLATDPHHLRLILVEQVGAQVLTDGSRPTDNHIHAALAIGRRGRGQKAIFQRVQRRTEPVTAAPGPEPAAAFKWHATQDCGGGLLQVLKVQ
ncbi:hypothetical protein D3C84_530680 [compost metagenome]